MVSELFERHDIVLEQKHQALSVIFNKLFDFDFEVEADITSLRSSFQGAFISSVLKKLGTEWVEFMPWFGKRHQLNPQNGKHQRPLPQVSNLLVSERECVCGVNYDCVVLCELATSLCCWYFAVA